MKFLIPVHSIVDVITNSSSVIYTEAHGNSVALCKKIINAILTAAGSTKTADDLFDISVQTYPNDVYEYIDIHLDDNEDTIFDKPIPDLEGYKKASTVKKNGQADWLGRRNALAAWENANKEALAALFEGQDADTETGLSTTLIVTTKNGVDIEFAKNALAMFNISERYDG